MQKHELYQAMSKPMARSFRQAEDEAMLEVRRENGKLYDEYRNAQAKWYEENKERTEKIQDNYKAHMELIQAQIKALYETQELVRERKDKAMDAINAECWEALTPLRESQQERTETNKAKGQAIMEALIAKYAERVQAKQSA